MRTLPEGENEKRAQLIIIIKKKIYRHNLSQDLNTVYLWLQAYKKKKEEEKKKLVY